MNRTRNTIARVSVAHAAVATNSLTESRKGRFFKISPLAKYGFINYEVKTDGRNDADDEAIS